jgi:hypothetical protein
MERSARYPRAWWCSGRWRWGWGLGIEGWCREGPHGQGRQSALARFSSFLWQCYKAQGQAPLATRAALSHVCSWWREVRWHGRVDDGGARWTGEWWWGAWRGERERELFGLSSQEDKGERGGCQCMWVVRQRAARYQQPSATTTATFWNGSARWGHWQVGPRGLDIFWRKFTPSRTLEFKTDAFPFPKNTQTLQDSRVGYSEQFLQSGWLQIPNRIQVIKFGTKSTLNFPWIFKGFKSLGKIY